jgi:hypothetical protein
MKLLSSLTLVLFSVSFFAGCSEDGTSNNYTVQQLFPLKAGNLWSYSAYEYNDDGSLRDEYYMNIIVDSATTYQGTPAFAGEMFGEKGILYFQNDQLNGVQTSQPFLIIKYPMAVGQPIIIRDTAYNQTRYVTYLQLGSNNEMVTVPAGTFSTLRYDMTRVAITTSVVGTNIDTISGSSTYYAVNVGLIKGEDNSYSGGTKHLTGKYTLYNYTLR